MNTIKINNMKTFICKGCKHELYIDFNLRTKGFCYLCDPNITLEECLSDEPIKRNIEKTTI